VHNYALFRRAEMRMVPLGVELFETWFADGLDYAWDLFTIGLPEQDNQDVEDTLYRMFDSWILFNCPIGASKERAEDNRPNVIHLSQIILDSTKQLKLRQDDIAFLKAGLNTTFSWYMIENVNQSISLEVRDLFSDERMRVMEHFIPPDLMQGDCVLARVMELFNVKAFIGIYPITLPASHAPMLLDARELVTKLV